MTKRGPGNVTPEEAELRDVLSTLSELDVRQRAKKLAAMHGVLRSDVLAMWRQEHRPSIAVQQEKTEPKLAGRPISELVRRVDPWPDPVDAAAWLEESEREVRRYLAMPEGAHIALASWPLYTHVHDRFGYAPYLLFESPAPECGKSTALRFAQRTSRLPLSTGSMTTATLYRVMDQYHPVLLADEQDGRLERNEELRLLFNEGFQQGAVVLRCVGDDAEPRGFDCFGPKALAGIGSLPKTIESRSIVVPMERSRTPLEELGPLDYPESLVRLQRQAARWALDVGALEVPTVAGFDRRLRDKWGPILAVAKAAGGDWLARVARAAQALHHDCVEEAEHMRLLSDTGRILASLGWPPFMATENLLNQLNALDEAPWSEMGKKGNGLTSHKLAALLSPFRIRPEAEAARNGGERRRGYRTTPIRKAWETYSPDTDDTEVTHSEGGYASENFAPEPSDADHELVF